MSLAIWLAVCLTITAPSITQTSTDSDQEFSSVKSDSTLAIYTAIIKNLESYSNTDDRRLMFDRRVLQWWGTLDNVLRVPPTFIGSHAETILETLSQSDLVVGFATLRPYGDYGPEFWHCNSDTATAAISLSLPKQRDGNVFQVLCWIETKFDFRQSRGRIVGFFTLLSFTLEHRDGHWIVIKRETIAIS